MAVPYTFATQTTSIPLAELDTNFSTPITIGTTVIPLGNVAPILENVTLGNVVIASGNVTLTNVNVINATITQATITTANVTTANITSAFITTANVTTANITTANVVTIRATTANIATANVTAMEAVAANVTTLRSTTINVTTANVTTLIATGNTILGDASTDTLNVGNGGLVKDASGNVGIGTSSPILGLTIKNDAGSTTYGQRLGSLVLESNNVTSGGGTDVVWSTGTQTNQRYASIGSGIEGNDGASGSRGFIVFATKSASATTTLTERMRIDTSGNVGIGKTATVGYQLDVGTPAVAGAVSGRIINSDTSSTSSAYMYATQGAQVTAIYSYGNGVSYAGAISNNDFALVTNNTEKMRISSTGIVSINVTGTAVGKLDVTTGTYRGYFDDNGGAAFRVNAVNAANSAYGPLALDGSVIIFQASTVEKMRMDSVGNTYVQTGNLWQYSPAPTALAAGANSASATNLQGGMFSAAQATAVTLTMPTGTAIDTGFAGVPAVDIGFYFYVINTGSALGAVTVAVNTNVTSLGSLVVAIGTSAQFRLRRTAANTYIMYRLS